MAKQSLLLLSRRERQIMDSLFKRGSATVSDVRDDLPAAPGYSAVRAMLSRLEEKQQVVHRDEGGRYVYRATVPRKSARDSALERLVATFFDGSPAKAVEALLDKSSAELDDAELDRLRKVIADARKKGR